MERSDIIEIVRQGKLFMNQAERTRWQVMECKKRYDETMTKLDKLRRRMVFVERETPEILELVSVMMDLEVVRVEKKSMENKFKNLIAASISYTLTAVELLNVDSTYISSQIVLVLRQAVMLIRSVRELNIDFSSIYAQAVKTRILMNCINDKENRMVYGSISRYLNQLINSIE